MIKKFFSAGKIVVPLVAGFTVGLGLYNASSFTSFVAGFCGGGATICALMYFFDD